MTDKAAAAAPISRKHRLMAAIASGEESSLPGSTNGSARLHCFICGGWMSPGREHQLQVRGNCGSPSFPFLLQQEPAPGARGVSAEGWVLVCSVCRCFLGEQWESFERSRTPVDKRMYWLKRPHQCDSRRGSQEWNPSYQPEDSQVQGRSSKELLESSLSSLSDQDISDQELELDHISQRARPQHRPPALGAPTRAQHFPGLPLPLRLGGSAQDAGHLVCQQQPLNSHPADVAHPKAGKGADSDALPTPRLSPLAAPSSSDETPGQLTPFKFSDSSNACDYSSSDDELPVPGGQVRGAGQNGEICAQEVARVNRQAREAGSVIAKTRSAAQPQDHSCFICGAKLFRSSQHTVHVQKQESTSNEPFFPFLWLHNPPPGACPLSLEGSTKVCSFCHVSLMQQWQGFEMANVPVLQRLYMVPLNAGVLGAVTKSAGERDSGSGRKTPQRGCYLCGEDCGKEAKAVRSRGLNGSARDNPMYFPFICLLPCPPSSKAMTECGEVCCCKVCYAVLEDMWAAYTVSEREELISSAQAFLRRYLQINASTSCPNSLARQPLRAGRTSVCLLCGTELEPGREFQLNVNPPSRHGDHEPFFPFLANCPRTAQGQPVDSTGLAFACVLCYHDLLEQWWRGKKSQHPSSPWSRQYKVDMFVCFFCRQERRRYLGLKTITINRLPVFLHAPRVADALVVDNGEHLTIGTCEDCRAMVLAGNCLKQGSQKDSLSPPSNAKDSSSPLHLSSLNKKQAALSSPPGRGEISEEIEQVTTDTVPAHSPQLTVDAGSLEHETTSMSHEPKSPSLGMISTATRTTATVSPLNPSSLNGSIVPNGSPATNSTLSVPSAHSASFAAALRKLAKQAEEPRGSSISSESSPVSSPATNHSSPASTPKRGPIGPILVPTAGHSVPSTPPVVTIAPTKTVNGLWRSESRQPEPVARGPSRERMHTESQHQSEKGTPSITSHLLGTPYAFGLTHSTVVQDSRFPPLNLQRPIPHVVTPGDMQEEYFRSFRPYHTGEELRMPTLPPMGLEAAATAYYHSSYLAHHPFPHPAFRVDDSYCLSALRSPFYPIATPASLPPLHPSAMHLHLPGMRFPAELSHSSLSALQSERLSERLQMDEEIRREREREREREKEREREAEREKEREREQEREKELEREKEKEREREREREMERDRERNREKEMNAAKAMENHYLHVPELHSLRGQQIDDRVKAAERLTPNRTDKPKEFALTCPKAVHPNLHQSPISHHAVPTLISNHTGFLPPGSSSAMLLQRNNEEEKWMAKQRQLRQEKEDRQCQVSEFRQQVLEQHLDIGRPGSHNEVEHRDSVRSGHSHHELCSRDQPQQLGAPPPLISPKPQHKEHHSSPAVLWNPVTLMDNHTEARRNHDHHVLNNYAGHYDSHRQPGPLVKMEKIHGHEESIKRREGPEKYQPPRGPSSLEHSAHTHSYGPPFAELEKSAQSILNQQRMSMPFPGQYSDMSLLHKSAPAYRQPHGPLRAPGPMYVYDELLQRHRRLISKLDLEEKKRKEAKEKGYYYDFDDSYDESDEEEVRAHLRRVAEQPPLKLDDSSEKLDFLRVFSLTTQAQREELLKQKRRKRRRMLMERSPSPPPIPNKRQAPSPRPLPTSKYSADEMNSTPDLAEKKRFLTSFSLAHILPEKRKEKETLIEMIHSIKQKTRPSEAPFKYLAPPSCSSPSSSQNAAAADSSNVHSAADSDRPPSATPAVPSLPELRKSAEPIRPELPKASEVTARPKEPGLHSDKSRPLEGPVGSRTVSVLTNATGALQKENSAAVHSLNEKSKPWEVFMAEDFAQQFHESVLQSTQRALQKHKGTTATLTAEQNHKLDASVRYNIPEMHSASGTLFTHQNGQHAATQTRKGMVCEREEESDNEDDEEEEDSRPFHSKWQGIEAVFEAYQEYVEEQNVERQILQAQCRRLETFHYNLSLTAEQLSLSMSELLAQKQKLASERERLQSELDHLRKCLALPTMHWSRSYFKSYPR
ncbi:genetic suppressor element 1 isoform X2 [Carcharodon carcharias]|uniref:genetic suppressor element 1 isoform X2 n=1 Tax=Carcharodon carcharias TaxID=13397 RepID=UPI001B7DAFF8|nr:genetic suppressor element 1 isoform X2 [Carcharodon carcharias]